MEHSLQLVQRLRRLDASRHQTLTHMHLSWLLDLNGDAFESVINESQAGSAKVSLKTLFHKHKKDKDQPTGMTQEKYKHIVKLINILLKTDNVGQEGLFRKCGQLSRQKRLMDDTQESLDQFDGLTAHDLASILKQQLAALPEPLLMNRNYEAALQIPTLSSSRQLSSLQLILQLIPPLHARATLLLARLLRAVSDQPSSRMSPETLGALFAPHVLCPKKLSAELLRERKHQHEAAVAAIINHSKHLNQVPDEYACDVARALTQMRDNALEVSGLSSISAPGSLATVNNRQVSKSLDALTEVCEDANESWVCSTPDEAVNTNFTFVDREATARARQTTDTQLALVELHEHIQSLPDSGRKQRLLRQFRQLDATGSPHLRSKSLTRHVKRQFSRISNKKRNASSHQTNTSALSHRPNTSGLQVNTSALSANTSITSSCNQVFRTPHVPRRLLAPTDPSPLARRPPVGSTDLSAVCQTPKRDSREVRTSRGESRRSRPVTRRNKHLLDSPPPTPGTKDVMGATPTVSLTPLVNVANSRGPTVGDVWLRGSHKFKIEGHLIPVIESTPVFRPAQKSPALHTASHRQSDAHATPRTRRLNSPALRDITAQRANSPVFSSKLNECVEKASHSPITASVRRATKPVQFKNHGGESQEHVMTPGSRKPIILKFSPEAAC